MRVLKPESEMRDKPLYPFNEELSTEVWHIIDEALDKIINLVDKDDIRNANAQYILRSLVYEDIHACMALKMLTLDYA